MYKVTTKSSGRTTLLPCLRRYYKDVESDFRRPARAYQAAEFNRSLLPLARQQRRGLIEAYRILVNTSNQQPVLLQLGGHYPTRPRKIEINKARWPVLAVKANAVCVAGFRPGIAQLRMGFRMPKRCDIFGELAAGGKKLLTVAYAIHDHPGQGS